MLSGYCPPRLHRPAVEAGAWGYVSKNENTETNLAAIRQVSKGGFRDGVGKLKPSFDASEHPD